DCVFLTKTVEAGHAGDDRSGYRWTLFGRPLRSPRDLPGPVSDPEQSARRLASDTPCLLFYRGLDCNLVGFDECGSEMRGRPPLEERVLENLPYAIRAHTASIRPRFISPSMRSRRQSPSPGRRPRGLWVRSDRRSYGRRLPRVVDPFGLDRRGVLAFRGPR